MFSQDEEFAAEMSESVILRIPAEKRCQFGDPGENITTEIKDVLHLDKAL